MRGGQEAERVAHLHRRGRRLHRRRQARQLLVHLRGGSVKGLGLHTPPSVRCQVSSESAGVLCSTLAASLG